MTRDEWIEILRVKPGRKVRMKDFDTGWAQTEELKELGKDILRGRAEEVLAQSIAQLSEAQELLYADNRFSVLIVFQAMDAAGKDGTIKHVMSGINPQGCQVFSFKKPSPEELDHNFLWRYSKSLPERGRIGIFNRSYYEEVLVVKVHPELLGRQTEKKKFDEKKLWKHRYEDINAFEKHLVRNDTLILKFFLNVSKETQKQRFLERLERPEKNWKFSSSDLTERGFWNDYMDAYEDVLSQTSTEWAPWYVVPADHKWVTRAIVADIITNSILALKLRYPEVNHEQLHQIELAKEALSEE